MVWQVPAAAVGQLGYDIASTSAGRFLIIQT
jgi:hypothetical protein